MSARIKATRSIIGIVAKVEFPCGCYALVASGQALIKYPDLRDEPAKYIPGHLPVHVCENWKRHKYELADAERDLAARARKARREARGRL